MIERDERQIVDEPDEVILVDPRELVCVHLRRTDGREDRFRVISCRYIQVHEPGGPTLGLELVYDPTNHSPGAAYYVPASRLQVIVVPAVALTRVHPYGYA
jgi:hypothetical protein